MKKATILLITLFLHLFAFSQAREDGDEGYQKIYSIVITKGGKVKSVIKQGALISSKIDRKIVKGKWIFKAYPDVVTLINNKGEIIGEIALNKEMPLRIVTPQKASGPSIGVGIGPVSISKVGSEYQYFNMKVYHAEIDERLETDQEKLRREQYQKKELAKKAKEAAKKAKKEARKKKK